MKFKKILKCFVQKNTKKILNLNCLTFTKLLSLLALLKL